MAQLRKQLNTYMENQKSSTRIFARSLRKKQPVILQFYYQNTRGLRTKLSKFLTASACSQSDVLCITESWLQTSIADGEVVDRSYNIFRKNRDPMIGGFKRGGGVFIAVKRSIQSELVIINNNTLEQVFIKIKDSLSYIRDKLPDASLLIIGDYNLPSSISRTECTKIIYENLSMLGCQQFNNVLSNHHKTLDLCFSNAGIVLFKTPAIIEEDKLHPAIDITLEFNTHLRPEVSSSYVFKKADYDSLNNFFIRTNWTDLSKIDYIDDKLNWFYQKALRRR
ncbi:uncharacterized protein LOC125777270 [Bactrocera dorsalis]|uniref:Uncharacterized protein LOC125777270 n=1 Tax=Bactrocera dorsalis TaxID=27457 RepID=A0ABM3JEE2_BACDO|nr:uncharacterized protein LOC125777270 [Bactrocera dorsalis]